MINKNFLLRILSFFFCLSVILISVPSVSAELLQQSNSPLINSNIATLKYEVKENTSLKNPVVDPNFNVLRNKEMNRVQAIIIVVAILGIAIIAPVATWWYFSR